MEDTNVKEKRDYHKIFTFLHKGAPKTDYIIAIIKVFICNIRKIYRKWSRITTPKKTFRMVLSDMWILITKYHGLLVIYQDINLFIDEYFTERIHEPNRSIHEYLLEREAVHLVSISSYNRLALIRKIDNKETGWQFLTKKNIPTTKRLGYIDTHNEQLRWLTDKGEYRTIEELLATYGKVFTKPDDSALGQGCGVLEITSSGSILLNGENKCTNELLKHFSKPFIVEEIIQQKEFAAIFHPNSLNTLRLITFRKPDGELFVERAIFRIGANGATTDNWCTGGIGVKVNRDGKLFELGYFHDPNLPPCKKHPDTGLVFKDYVLPDYEDAKKLVLKAHSVLKVNAVGWDIAFTKDGPIIVEMNPYFSIFQPQCGGLRKFVYENYLEKAANNSAIILDLNLV